MTQGDWTRGFGYILAALLVVLVVLIGWVRWMIVEPHWLELFR